MCGSAALSASVMIAVRSRSRVSGWRAWPATNHWASVPALTAAARASSPAIGWPFFRFAVLRGHDTHHLPQVHGGDHGWHPGGDKASPVGDDLRVALSHQGE